MTDGALSERALTRRELLRGAVMLASALPALRPASVLAADSNSSVAKVWADAIFSARYEDLTADVVRRAKLCILDNIAVITHTSTLRESLAFLKRPIRNGGPHEATVWGVGAKLPVEVATACNAYLIHGNEIDDSDFRSNYRPSCVSLPGPLSVAEFTRASGRDLILATAIAYTVNGRLAAPLDRLQGLGFMPSSVVGGGGTAAAAAKLLRLPADQLSDALTLGIAGGGGLFQYYFDQTEDKKLHVSRTARYGVEVAQLAKQGWKGPSHIIEGVSGLLPSYLRGTGRSMDFEKMKRDISQFEGPLYVFPKFTSCSSSIGPFIDALNPVYKRERIKVTDIDRFVIVREWPTDGPFAQKIIHFEPPQTIVGAQLNMNYSIALYLHRGSASVYDFTESALRDKSVLELAGRTGYEQVPEGSDYTVRLVMKNGRTIEAPFKYSRGEKPEPELIERRMEKFALLTRERLNEANRKRVIEMVENLDSVRDVSQWTLAMNRLIKPALVRFTNRRANAE